MEIKKIQVILLKLLIIFIPIHYILFSLALKNYKILSIWRDFVIILLFITTLKEGKMRINRFGKIILLITAMVIMFCITNLCITSINVARTYIVPMLIYFPLINMNINEKDIRELTNWFWIVAVAISIYGIFQAYVLGPKFLIDMGYKSLNGRLASTSFYISNNWTQQRITGTFVGPNNCGCYLAISIIILYYFKKYTSINSKIYLIGIAIVGVALLGTLSRSAWIGTLFGFIFLKKKNNHNINKKTIATIIGMLLGVFLVDYFLVDGKIMNIAYTQIINTLTKNDASMNAHIRYLYEPILDILAHPFGYKFGTNGSFVLSSYSANDVHLVESSIYLMCYEFGLFGAILFFLPYCLEINGCKIAKINEAKVGGAVGLCVLIIYIFLPSIQAYEQPFYFFFCAGLSKCITKLEYIHT